MHREARVLFALSLAALVFVEASANVHVQAQGPVTLAFVNGRWFDGKTFSARTMYSLRGVFTSRKPPHVDQTLDLSGGWVVPPFGEAHNHNIGTGVEDRDRQAIRRFLADGVFYVKSQGNLPLTDAMKTQLGLNRPDSIDVVLAQGSLTATGGHPAYLVEELLLGRGFFPGYTKETLRDFRYFAIDSPADLERKWPAVLALHPDFIKTFLWRSDDYEQRKADPAVGYQKGLDPKVLAGIVENAHAVRLRVSTHVATNADFHNAVSAGVDEIAHLPQLDTVPIAAADARLAAKRGIVVDTTLAAVTPTLVKEGVIPEQDVAAIRRAQTADLKLLTDHGVRLAVGSDNPADSSVAELLYLHGLGVLDARTLLKMWTETTPQSIFPGRKIGRLGEGAEASFLVLEGNPLDDIQNVRRIRLRVKQGVEQRP
jgi:hypothetical protein